MKKQMIVLTSILTLCLAGCSLRAGTEEPTAGPQTLTPRMPTRAAPSADTDGRCGDGRCDGPENAQNCPEDCSPDTTDAQSTPDEAASGARPAEDPGTYWVTNPTSGVELFTTVLRPDDWSGEPLPTIVMIPGGDDDSSGLTESGIGLKAVECGYAVVAFDADGRGRSGGEEDYNGFIHQDGLAAVVQFAASRPEVDADRMGLMSFSFGVTMASGALARYPELPIRFFIDWEGPADRRDATVGCKPSAHYDWPSCDDDAAWAEREALTFIPDVVVPYLRVQTKNDHVQPDVIHAVHMVNAAVAGDSPWVRLNDHEPNATYDPASPPAMLSSRGSSFLDDVMLDYAGEMFGLHAAPAQTSSASTTPVYVTFATHVEEKLPLPCGDEATPRCCDEYARFRSNLIAYADLFLQYGVKWNLQPNVRLLELGDMCETEAMRQDTTSGQSLLPYLIEEKGAMVDAHAHPHDGHNYADVMRQLHLHGVPIEMLTVVGGCYTGEAQQLETFEAGWQGEAFPNVVWRPLLYTFPAIAGHPVEAEDYSSGMWKPAGFDYNPLEGKQGDQYYTHDTSKRMAMVGSGFVHSCALGHDQAMFYYASDYVERLVARIDNGTAPGGRLYTASIATNQQHIDDPDAYMPAVEAQLQALEDEVEAGQVIYVHYQELPEVWEEAYASRPNIYRLDQFEPDEFTCDGEGNRIP